MRRRRTQQTDQGSCSSQSSLPNSIPVCTTLPEDVLMDILSRLPVKSLLRYMCVCKRWGVLIQSPIFISMQSKRSPTHLAILHRNDYVSRSISLLSSKTYELESNIPIPCVEALDPSFQLLGCSNGLFCVTMGENENILLNPATKELKMLPPPEPTGRKKLVGLGFGFDPNSNDYKMVRVFDAFKNLKTDKVFSKADVYSLSSDSWRRSESVVDGVVWNNYLGRVVLNGVLHWTAHRVESVISSSERAIRFIMSFDLGTEKFSDIMMPRDFYKTNSGTIWRSWNLSVCQESLSMIVGYQNGEDIARGFAIWVMKEYGVAESWTKHVVVAPESWIRSIAGFGNNGDQVLFAGGESHDNVLLLYDQRTEETKSLHVRGLEEPVEVVNYVQSLVPIKGKKIMTTERINPPSRLCCFFMLLLFIYCVYCHFYILPQLEEQYVFFP